jgi:hypothetical protein
LLMSSSHLAQSFVDKRITWLITCLYVYIYSGGGGVLKEFGALQDELSPYSSHPKTFPITLHKRGMISIWHIQLNFLQVGRIPSEKLIVTQLVEKKTFTIYGTRSYVIVFTRPHHCSLSWAR